MEKRCAVAMWLMAMWASPGSAQSPSMPVSVVRPLHFDQAPVIDGRIDDVAWGAAARLSGFRQVQPGDNLEPSQHTEVLIGYDQRALYLAFRADDNSGKVRATIARRDAITGDDIVGVYLDTFQDRRRAYYIFFNPSGIQADGRLPGVSQAESPPARTVGGHSQVATNLLVYIVYRFSRVLRCCR